MHVRPLTAAACLLALLGFLSFIAWAPSTQRRPVPFVVASESGRTYFKMVPDLSDPKVWDVGNRTAFRVGADGDEVLWKSSGWFAWQLHLSNSGEYLVRIGAKPRGREPSQEHLAIAFYANGTELRRYSTRELIEDDARIMRSLTHYQFTWPLHWSGITEEGDSAQFEFVTVDRIRYVFDCASGEILSREQLDE